MMNILLAGFMGTGKSTVGRALAKRLNMRFVDTDILIEQTAGMTIPEVFSRMGEPAFREMEARLVAAATELKGAVIAVGGGAIQNPETRALVKQRCVVALLTARPQTILARVETRGERPMLTGYPEPEQKLARVLDLLQQRMPAYLDAGDMVIDTERGIDLVVDEIISNLPKERLLPVDRPLPVERPANAFATARSVAVTTPGGQYVVHIGSGVIAGLSRLIKDSCADLQRVLVVSNPMVSQLWLTDLTDELEGAGYQVETALVADGETHKNLQSATGLYDLLNEKGYDRSTVIVALGGGVVGDLAGFVAATYMRGVRLVQIPTTLLAQVDSSIGGKVAVNYGHRKNLIGAFYQPVLVVSDVDTLQTLPDGVFSEGMAEVIKTAIIGGEPLFSLLERNAAGIVARNPATLQEVVAACAEIKAGVVSEDERDEDGRMILNLGHTFGHAVESACAYQGVSHGQAVAVGVCLSAKLSHSLGFAAPGLLSRISGLMHRFNLPTSPGDLAVDLTPDLICSHAKFDKKRHLGRLRFVVPVAVGEVRLVEGISERVITELLHAPDCTARSHEAP
ncbi:MAG: 3-dehydroquinate synthase [Firmicutes bacterium]|nr:3-dehydroquinate synthase [Bacillota bacterium]